jgi:hypothetical protein
MGLVQGRKKWIIISYEHISVSTPFVLELAA